MSGLGSPHCLFILNKEAKLVVIACFEKYIVSHPVPFDHIITEVVYDNVGSAYGKNKNGMGWVIINFTITLQNLNKFMCLNMSPCYTWPSMHTKKTL